MSSLKDYMVVSYGYETIYGFSGGGLERIKKEIVEYNLYGILETCSKIALTLHANGFANQQTQIKLIRDIFADDLDLRKRIVAAIRQGKAPWAIFTEHQLLCLVKIALQFAPHDQGKSVTPQDVGKVGRWLLIATDMCLEDGVVKNLIIPREQQREKVREFVARQYFFMASERLPYRVVRFEKLFNLIRKIHPKFNIDRFFSKATGSVALKDYISFCFFFLVNWVNKTTKTPDITKEWIVCKDKYFEQTSLKPKEIDSVLSVLLLDVEKYSPDYQKAVNDILGGQDIYAYNFLQLRQRPLITFNDKCFVTPSPNFLMDKATEGIYWILENYFRANNLKQQRDLLPSVWGDAFEEYIHQRLESSFGKSSYYRNFTVKGDEKFDGIVDGQSVVLCIETKYAHWSYKAQLTGKREDMEVTLKQLFSSGKKVKGLGQLTRSIIGLEKQIWQLPFDRKNRKILPILVVGEMMPMDAYNRKFYEDLARTAGVFYESSTVMPFIILNAEEIEMLEAIAVEHGKDMTENLLIQYSEMFGKRNADGYVKEALEFKNFLHAISYPAPNNPKLFKEFDRISLRAQKKGFPKSFKKKNIGRKHI